MCKVSLIIPIYNVSPFLRRCLDSALAQTLEDIEIICVEDGSTDGSADILREYERTYPKIRAVYKENGGLSSARNAGLNVARGDYVAFLDSDDWFEPNACEAAYRRATETGAEITRFFTQLVNENGATPQKVSRRRLKASSAETTEDNFGGLAETVATDPVERLHVCHFFGGPNVWSKLWNRDFLERNRLRFREGILWEDVDFTTRAALLAKKVATLRQTLHHYWRHSSSIIGERGGSARHADDLTTSFDSAIDAGIQASVDERTLDWLFATKLKMLAVDFRSFNDWRATETLARKLRESDWRRVFDPNFEISDDVRSFYSTLWNLYFSDSEHSNDRSLFSFFHQKKATGERAQYQRNDFVERGKKAIAERRAASFDVFDTLLVRPFVKPCDLFLYIEEREGVPGFAEERREAEKTARRRGRPEVTLDDIYREMKPERRALAEREIEYERRTLTANPDVLELFRFAKELKKPVFIVSDMYHSADSIRSFLQKNGVDGFDKLYVSSESRRTKESGELFDLVLKENGLAPEDLLHFGDNVHSDVDVPKSKRVAVFPVEKLIDRYFAFFPREKKYYEESANRLEASIVLAMRAIRQNAETKTVPLGNYWKRLGYRYGGVAILAFLQFIEKTARENSVDELAFVARDGWTLKKAYSLLFGDSTRSEYVYASRRIGGGTFDDESTSESSEYRRTILRKYYASKTAPDATKIALVDTVSLGRLSALKLASAALPEKDVFGIYWCIANENLKPALRCVCLFPYRASESANIMTENWNLMEFFMTSTEPPIVELSEDGTPVYAEPNEFERWRSRLYSDVSQGELDFIVDFIAFFGVDPPTFSRESAVETINLYLTRPTALDLRRLALVWHAGDAEHREYRPLLANDSRLPKTNEGVAPRELYNRAFGRAFWKCVVKPVSLRIKKKGIALSLFPKLHKNIYCRYFSLTPHFTLIFQIGMKRTL